MLRFVSRFSSASLVRLALLLTLVVGSGAAGPVRPTTSLGAVAELAIEELETAWQQVLAAACECD